MTREEEIKQEIIKLNDELLVLRKQRTNEKNKGKYRFVIYRENSYRYDSSKREHYRSKFNQNDAGIRSYIGWGYSIDFYDKDGNFLFTYKNEIPNFSEIEWKEICNITRRVIQKVTRIIEEYENV